MHAGLPLAAILAATILSVVSHEFGHFVAARLIGWPVRAFAIGLGRRVLTRESRSGTSWRLGLLPIGGYVILRPDPPAGVTSPRLATALRMGILAAGPAANLLLAATLYAGAAYFGGVPTYLPVASTIDPGSPAAHAGFREGDRIAAVEGLVVTTFDELRPLLLARPRQAVTFSVVRGDQQLALTATLAAIVENGRTVGHLGIWSHESVIRRVGAGGAAVLGASETWQAAADTLAVPANALRGERTSSRVPGLADPLGLARNAVRPNGSSAAALAALLSIEMALLNLLPLPMLDGGALLLAANEMRRRGEKGAPGRVGGVVGGRA